MPDAVMETHADGEKTGGGQKSFLEKNIQNLTPHDVLPSGSEEGERTLKGLVRKLLENPQAQEAELYEKMIRKWIEGESLFTVADAYAANHPEKKVNQAHQLEQFVKLAVEMKLDGVPSPETEAHLVDWLANDDMLLCRVDKTVWIDPPAKQ